MNEQELSSLSCEISKLTRSVKTHFKNPKTLQVHIKQLNKLEQQLIEINKKLKAQDSTINKIISSIKDATENITSTSLNTAKATAKFGLSGLANATKITAFVGGLVAGDAVGKIVGIDFFSQLAGVMIEQPLSSLGDNISNLSERIKIISKEQKITEKEALKQLNIAFIIKTEQLILQCHKLKEFINKCTENEAFYQKVTNSKFPKLKTIEKEVEQLTQEIRQDFHSREIEVMKQRFEQIENAQARFAQIEKDLSDIVESLRAIANGSIVFDSDAIENLLTTLNQEIIYLRICSTSGIILGLNDREETIKDIDCRFIQVHSNIKKIILEADKKYDRAKNMLCKANRRKEASNTKSKEKHNIQQELAELSRESSKSKSNSLIPILMGLIVLSFGSWIGWNFFNSRQVQNKAEKLLSEVQDINKTSDIHNLQTYQDKIKKSILLLETIPDAPGSDYKKVNNDISKLHSQLNAVEQKIKASNRLSEQANKDLGTAESLAMEASIIVQNPPHPLEIWQQAQGKWQESIKLLEAIPENLPAYVQAQEKLVTYQTNYAAITKRIEIEQNASNTINKVEDLAKQSIE